LVADVRGVFTNHTELDLRRLVPHSREVAEMLGDECALIGRGALSSGVDLGASQGNGEDRLRQLPRVRGHSRGELPR
jgi:hypothetical protein